MSTSHDPTKNVPPRKALGRGLGALLGQVTPAQGLDNQNPQTSPQSVQQTQAPAHVQPLAQESSKYSVHEVELSKVEPNPEQPRKHFNSAKLEELSASLKEHGIVQPIVVRKVSLGKYQIIAGERRWRAAKLAGLPNIPVIVRDDKIGVLENDLASLVENLQREDLSPIELAIAYDRMIKLHSFTQDSLAQRLGVSRVAVANTLRLLRLPESVKEMVANKVLSEGHSRALLSLNSDQQIVEMAQQIIEEGLTVRDVEARVRSKTQSVAPAPGAGVPGRPTVNQRAPELLALEDELRNLMGTKVVLRGNAGRGTIEIYYAGKDSLNRLVHQLRGSQQ